MPTEIIVLNSVFTYVAVSVWHWFCCIL